MARRIPVVTREEVAEEHRAAYDEIAGIRGRPPVVGPSSVMVHSPEMAVRVNRLSEFLGESDELPETFKRLAAIIAARSMDCQFIWNAHAAFGRQSGLSDELVDNLRDKKDLPALSAEESAVIEYGRELFRTRKVSQANYDAAFSLFGVRGLVELTNLMGYYSSLAFNINAFDVGLPDNLSELPLPV